MKKLFGSLLLLVLLAVPFSSYASAPEPVLTTTHRIAQVTFLEGDVCSATAVGPHALLSDTHCELGSDMLGVDGKVAHILKRIRDGRDHTIFIVDLKFDTVAELAADAPTKGDDVWIDGNPAGLPMLVRRGTYAGSINVSQNPFMVVMGNLYDINGFFGDSGAAIFNAKGEVIDTVSQGLNIKAEGDQFRLSVGYGLHFTPKQLHEALTD